MKTRMDSGVAGLGNEALLGSLQCVPGSLQDGQWEGRGQLSSLLRLLCVPAAHSSSPGWQEPKASPAVGMEGNQSLDGYF